MRSIRQSPCLQAHQWRATSALFAPGLFALRFFSLNFFQELAVDLAEFYARQQVWAASARPAQRLFAPPTGDSPVIATEQYRRNLPAPKLWGPRILRIFQQAAAVRFFDS